MIWLRLYAMYTDQDKGDGLVWWLFLGFVLSLTLSHYTWRKWDLCSMWSQFSGKHVHGEFSICALTRPETSTAEMEFVFRFFCDSFTEFIFAYWSCLLENAPHIFKISYDPIIWTSNQILFKHRTCLNFLGSPMEVFI